jgi:hypothetical protein
MASTEREPIMGGCDPGPNVDPPLRTVRVSVCRSFGPWLHPSDNFPDPISDRPSDGPDFRPTFSRRGYCKNNDHVSLSVGIDSDIGLLKISCRHSGTRMSEGELE